MKYQGQCRHHLLILREVLFQVRIFFPGQDFALQLFHPFDEDFLRVVIKAEPTEPTEVIRRRCSPLHGIEVVQLLEHRPRPISGGLVRKAVNVFPSDRLRIDQHPKALEEPVIAALPEGAVHVPDQLVRLDATQNRQADIGHPQFPPLHAVDRIAALAAEPFQVEGALFGVVGMIQLGQEPA